MNYVATKHSRKVNYDSQGDGALYNVLLCLKPSPLLFITWLNKPFLIIIIITIIIIDFWEDSTPLG